MVGIEIDMVVLDSLEAIDAYEKIFDIERVEVTNFKKGGNEAVFTMYGTRFHLLDENQEYQLIAPKKEDPKSMWINIVVPDIRKTYKNAMDLGCTEVQPVTEMSEMGVINAMFMDSFGYLWMLHQIEKEVSFEERCALFEEEFGK